MPYKDPEKRREYCLRYYYSNKDKYRRYEREHQDKILVYRRARREKMRIDAIQVLGGGCYKCGLDDHRALEIHHIERKGKDSKRERSGPTMWKKIVDGNVNGYELLCASCHKIEHYDENKEGWGRAKD